jgi:hypothetical protein
MADSGAGRFQRAAQEASGIPHSSDPAYRARPALPCPSWCTREGSHDIHQTTRHYAAAASVALAKRDGYLADIYVSGHVVSLDEAESMASLMVTLEHEEIAAAIRELAALAEGETDA